MAWWASIYLQDGASNSQEQLVTLYDHAMVILVMISVLVAYFLVASVTNSFSFRALTHNQVIEFVWTCAPCFILLSIALPSLRLLYLLDEPGWPSVTIKAIGHQWYWSYEYSELGGVEFDSYMVPQSDTTEGLFRLLDVDNRMVVPFGTQMRILVSSADVLHSWTVPCLGVKADALPGRLNQLSLKCMRPGLFFGQCSEICGANHSFMPIAVESVNTETFINWVSSQT